jgi:hypothetical protein
MLRHLAALVPNKGWVHEALMRGALVLIDGVDEVPASRRKQWLEWLQTLVGAFGASVFAVSSRPAALDADVPVSLSKALVRYNFQALTLEPMLLSDSEALVHRWHEAVARDLKSADVAVRLRDYERGLRQIMRERPAIRVLASNPLLCAMMCTLNWDRQRRLPDDRMELYRLALELLLDRREHERGIEGMALDRPTKEILLAGVAVWMLRNGLSEVDRERVENQVALLARRLPQLAGAASEVVQELLERSGVLRQPQHGIVDFVHRTFLEYLGARALVEQDDVDYLVEKAREEGWREVVVFAAGHTSGRMRDAFVAKLLRGRLLWRRPIEADVAAVCCMETVGRNLDPDLMARLRAKAAELFPPETLELAALLAPAAALDHTLLMGHEAGGPEAVAACIRTAALVGTPPMLDVIAAYAGVEGDAVELELVRAFAAFDEAEFEARVFTKRPTILGVPASALEKDELFCLRLIIRCAAEAPALRMEAMEVFKSYKERGELRLDKYLRPDKYLRLGNEDIEEAFDLGFRFSFFSSSSVSAEILRGLEALAKLTKLSLPPVEPDVIPLLGKCGGLRMLIFHIFERIRLRDLRHLHSLQALRCVGPYSSVDVSDMEVLKELAALERLVFFGISAPGGFNFVGSGSHLRTIGIYDCKMDDIRPISRATELASLSMGELAITDFTPLAELPFLKNLQIDSPMVDATLPYGQMHALESIELSRTSPSFTVGLAGASNVRELTIIQPSFTTFPELPPKLERLILGGHRARGLFERLTLRTPPSLSLASLGQLEYLEQLHLYGCYISDADKLASLGRLKAVSLIECSGEMTQIAKILMERGVEILQS